MDYTNRIGTITGCEMGTPWSYISTISYKGVDITYDELDELVAKKRGVKAMPAPKPKERIVFDGDLTIYYDKYGNKTMVSKMPEDEYDAEKAVLWALLKSKGIKPKKVQELIANSIDRDVKRKERAAKKELAKQAAKEVEVSIENPKKGQALIRVEAKDARTRMAVMEMIAQHFKSNR